VSLDGSADSDWNRGLSCRCYRRPVVAPGDAGHDKTGRNGLTEYRPTHDADSSDFAHFDFPRRFSRV
jgi:hypothetical protein